MESQINPEQNNQRKHLSFVEKIYCISYKTRPFTKRIKESTKKDRITHKEGTASQHRRGIAEGIISLNVRMRFKNV